MVEDIIIVSNELAPLEQRHLMNSANMHWENMTCKIMVVILKNAKQQAAHN